MRLFVTGSNGFLGSAVVASALERGHEVVGLVRSDEAGARLRAAAPGVEVAVGDLRDPASWVEALATVDGVVHLAAAKAGGFYEVFPATVVGTERLVEAMRERGVDRIVHVSSLAVFDFDARPAGATFDETVPDERDRLTRDAYGQTKLYQEEVVREAGLRHTIVRPGAVWGRGDLWDGGLGQVVGPVWAAVNDAVPQRFTYVENCAEAIVMAAEEPAAVGEVLMVVDDDLPTRSQYAAALRRRGVALPRAVPVPFGALRAVAGLLATIDRRLLGGRLKVPSMLTLRALVVRFKPFRFDNGHVKRVLGWSPRYDFEASVDRATSEART